MLNPIPAHREVAPDLPPIPSNPRCANCFGRHRSGCRRFPQRLWVRYFARIIIRPFKGLASTFANSSRLALQLWTQRIDNFCGPSTLACVPTDRCETAAIFLTADFAGCHFLNQSGAPPTTFEGGKASSPDAFYQITKIGIKLVKHY